MMLKRKKWLPALVAVFVLAALVVSACGKTETPPPTTTDPGSSTGTPPPPAEKKPAVGGTINLRLARDPDNFNPILYSTAYGGYIVGEVFDGLFEFDTNWEPQPKLAESWEFESDTKLVIKLKKGVKFHDGGDFTADDVVFTLMSIKAEGYDGPRSASMGPVESMEATDPHTVVVTLKEPFAPVLVNLNYGIMQKANFEGTAVADLGEHHNTMHPIGTGPYKFNEYQPGEYVILDRNENWHMSADRDGAPFIERQNWKVIPDDQTALAAFENGEIDVETPTPDQANRIRDEYAGTLIPVDYERNGWGFMQLNNFKGHLADVKLRQALTFALDRQTIIDAAMDGLAVVPVGPIPPVSWAFDANVPSYPFDPDKARALLDEAGWTVGADGIREKDGEKLQLSFMGSAGSALIENLTTIAKQNWADVGIDTVLELGDFNALMENYVATGDFDVVFYAFNLGLDPDSLYGLFHSSAMNLVDGVAKGFNRARYENPRVDELLEQGRRETDPAKRKAIYSEAQGLIAGDAPFIPVYSNLYTDFYNGDNIKGGVLNFPGSGMTQFYRMWMVEQ